MYNDRCYIMLYLWRCHIISQTLRSPSSIITCENNLDRSNTTTGIAILSSTCCNSAPDSDIGEDFSQSESHKVSEVVDIKNATSTGHRRAECQRWNFQRNFPIRCHPWQYDPTGVVYWALIAACETLLPCWCKPRKITLLMIRLGNLVIPEIKIQ